MVEEAKTFMVEDARLLFRNFKGEAGRFNAEGDRSFCAVLDEGTAEQMLKDGWNVKHLKPREEDDGELEVGTPYIQVKVNFNNWPPNIVMITSTARTHLKESSVEVLDYADVATCDFIARGYDWDVNGKQGTKAYLQTMFVTINENPLELKYAVREE